MKSISPFFQNNNLIFRNFQEHFLLIAAYNSKLFNLFYDKNFPTITELSFNLENIYNSIQENKINENI